MLLRHCRGAGHILAAHPGWRRKASVLGISGCRVGLRLQAHEMHRIFLFFRVSCLWAGFLVGAGRGVRSSQVKSSMDVYGTSWHPSDRVCHDMTLYCGHHRTRGILGSDYLS